MTTPSLLLTIAALLAYALAPGINVLQRVMPRFLAILIMYLLVLGAMSFLVYLIVTTAIEQISSLAITIQKCSRPVVPGNSRLSSRRYTPWASRKNKSRRFVARSAADSKGLQAVRFLF